jgi:uncharacterized integral membrane protein
MEGGCGRLLFFVTSGIMPAMRAIIWVIRLLLFLLLFGFAIKNDHLVVLNFFFGSQWQLPLVFVILPVRCSGADRRDCDLATLCASAARSRHLRASSSWPSAPARARPRSPAADGPICRSLLIHGNRTLVAARAAAVLRAGLAGRPHRHPQVVQESRALPRSYLTGLNFLLNEQPDKAIDAFIEAVRIDPQTVELHFALGSLFRRRGETDRAIRIHQNAGRSRGHQREQRLQALSELGQDFLKAGLLDRAEAVFVQLRGTRANDVRLAQPARDLSAGEGLGQGDRGRRGAARHEGVMWQKEVANFHCELAAANALANSRFDEARRGCSTALRGTANACAPACCSAICTAQGR